MKINHGMMKSGNKRKKITKLKFTEAFFLLVAVLAILRWACPDVAKTSQQLTEEKEKARQDSIKKAVADSLDKADLTEVNGIIDASELDKGGTSIFFNADGTQAVHRIVSVPNFGKTFPDLNDIQLTAAKKRGIEPVQNREEAENLKEKLVYIGSSPYYTIDNLRNSIPYLVPRAAVLLNDIGRAYFDSLQIKGIPLHKLLITSVMRSMDDVSRLRTHNKNASAHSCHMYGTTFDVSYNRYLTVQTEKQQRRKVRNDSLKWVLSEVLRDMRKENRCYIKYEVHQGCFHVTVR